jgi:hypothetical protein
LPAAKSEFRRVLSQPQLFFGWRRANCAAKSMGWDRQKRRPVLYPIAAELFNWRMTFSPNR